MSNLSSAQIAIVDYGMGNLYSVRRACEHAGLSAAITGSPAEVLQADAVVLPGVGAMPEAMRALDASGMSGALRDLASRGTLLFGVCLGMQLLMREGSEFSSHPGLGLVPGVVQRLEGIGDEGSPLKVPHIGWNAVHRRNSQGGDPWAGTPFESTQDGEYLYFVHSYCVVPDDPLVPVAWTRYGSVEFCSALAVDNIFGCQFHPERSGPQGLRIYRHLAQLIGERLTASRQGTAT